MSTTFQARNRPCAHRVEPHLVDVAPVLVLGKLNTPLASMLVGLVFPGRNDALLHSI